MVGGRSGSMEVPSGFTPPARSFDVSLSSREACTRCRAAACYVERLVSLGLLKRLGGMQRRFVIAAQRLASANKKPVLGRALGQASS